MRRDRLTKPAPLAASANVCGTGRWPGPKAHRHQECFNPPLSRSPHDAPQAKLGAMGGLLEVAGPEVVHLIGVGARHGFNRPGAEAQRGPISVPA
jgi:hypothetical protein